MVDIRKDFDDSFHLLMRHKKIIIPNLFASLIPLVLILLFLNMSGLNPLLKELVSVSAEFNKQKQDYLLSKENIGKENYTSDLVNYLGKDSKTSAYNKERSVYLEQMGYDFGRYKQLLNTKNITLLIIFLLLSIISSFYFSCMAYAITALVLKKKAIHANNLIRVTNKFLLKLLLLEVLAGFIFIAPIIIITGVIVLLFFLNNIIGALSIFIFIILFFVYFILIGLRLFFLIPSMFMEEQGATRSIKHSWHLTKGHLKQVFIIFVLIFGITLFINLFVSQPLFGTYLNFLFEASWIKAAINFLLFALFLVLESFVFTFQYIFLFYTYTDFKELRDKPIIKKGIRH